jgi:hypothetical protein
MFYRPLLKANQQRAKLFFRAAGQGLGSDKPDSPSVLHIAHRHSSAGLGSDEPDSFSGAALILAKDPQGRAAGILIALARRTWS